MLMSRHRCPCAATRSDERRDGRTATVPAGRAVGSPAGRASSRSVPERAQVTGAVRRPELVAGVIVCALGAMVIAGCGGSDPSLGAATTSVTAQTASIVPKTTVSHGVRVTRLRVSPGPPVVDGTIGFRVTSVRQVSVIPATTRTGLAARPRLDGLLWELRVTVANDGRIARSPFCGGRGIIGEDRQGRTYFIDSQAALWVNTTYCQLLAPGARVDFVLPMYTPTGAVIALVNVWDVSARGNFDGSKSYVSFVRP